MPGLVDILRHTLDTVMIKKKKQFALMNLHIVEVIANVSHDDLLGRLDQDPLVSFILG